MFKMSGKSKQYSKLRNEDEDSLTAGDTKEKPNNFSDSEGLSNGSSRKLSKRQKAVLVSFIAITLVVVTTVTIILTQKKGMYILFCCSYMLASYS